MNIHKKIVINHDISNLNHITHKKIKSELYEIANFVKNMNMSLEFINFDPLKFLSPDRCCLWFSGHKISPKVDLMQLIVAIRSNQKQNRPKIQCKLVY